MFQEKLDTYSGYIVRSDDLKELLRRADAAERWFKAVEGKQHEMNVNLNLELRNLLDEESLSSPLAESLRKMSDDELFREALIKLPILYEVLGSSPMEGLLRLTVEGLSKQEKNREVIEAVGDSAKALDWRLRRMEGKIDSRR